MMLAWPRTNSLFLPEGVTNLDDEHASIYRKEQVDA